MAFIPLAGRLTPALVILVVAGVTDVLDGWVARHLSRPSRWGDWLDPVCDKVFVTGVLVGLYLSFRPPLLVLVFILTRELLLLILLVVYHLAPSLRGSHYNYRAHVVGKANTVAQFLTVTALLIQNAAAWPLSILCIAFGIASAVVYGARGLKRPS
jgi:phosphatidylglycerophosphate synthase